MVPHVAAFIPTRPALAAGRRQRIVSSPSPLFLTDLRALVQTPLRTSTCALRFYHLAIGMKPNSCKAKGMRFQRELARAVSSALELPREDVRSTSSGANGADLCLSSAARDLFPFAVEAKNVERPCLKSAWPQALRHAAGTTLTPMVVSGPTAAALRLPSAGRPAAVIISFSRASAVVRCPSASPFARR